MLKLEPKTYTCIRDLPMLAMIMSGPYVRTKGKMSKSIEDWTAGSLASSLTKAESLFLPPLFSNDSCGRREKIYGYVKKVACSHVVSYNAGSRNLSLNFLTYLYS